MIRVAAYCRVSTDKDDQANSFESQQKYFMEQIARQPDWELQGIYADEGISGTSTRKRTRFNAMIQAAKEGKIDLIVTKEVSRFARNTIDTLRYTRELKELGIGVRFLLDNIDTMSSEGEFRLTIMSSIAQEESNKTSQRVKWGQKERMKQGVVFGGSLLGYTVTGGQMTIEPEGAAIVREIFRKYIQERKGSHTIARELREAGVLSSRGHCLWSAATVSKILKNEKYCGDLVQKKTYTPDFLTHNKKYNHGQEEKVVLRNHHEPIIGRETFEAVQREMSRRRTDAQSSGHGNRYPLSGKIKCGCCGTSFQSRTRYKAGESYKVWRCGKANLEGKHRKTATGENIGCDLGRQLRDDVAMDILKRSVESVKLNRTAITNRLTSIVQEVLTANWNDGTTELRKLEREWEKLENKKADALDSFVAKDITEADFQFLKKRYEREMTRCKEQIDAIHQRHKLNTESKMASKNVSQAIRSIVSGERNDPDFYGNLLEHITVYPNGEAEVFLQSLPVHWTYVLDGIAQYEASFRSQCVTSVPISVSKPLSSG